MDDDDDATSRVGMRAHVFGMEELSSPALRSLHAELLEDDVDDDDVDVPDDEDERDA